MDTQAHTGLDLDIETGTDSQDSVQTGTDSDAYNRKKKKKEDTGKAKQGREFKSELIFGQMTPRGSALIS